MDPAAARSSGLMPGIVQPRSPAWTPAGASARTPPDGLYLKMRGFSGSRPVRISHASSKYLMVGLDSLSAPHIPTLISCLNWFRYPVEIAMDLSHYAEQ
jgi:hypothetical protein